MDHAAYEVLRVYKNAGGDTIRIDTIGVSGTFQRKNIYKNPAAWPINPSWVSGSNVEPRYDWGDWIFHPSARGRKLGIDLINLGSSRVVSTIDMVGSWTALAAGPNYVSVTWRGGLIDLSDLPQVGASV